MCRPLAFVVTSVTDRNEHVAAQADSSLSNRRASLSRSLATDVSVDRRIGIGIEIGGIENGIGIENLELELELKTGIDFLQWLPQHLLINQPFPNFSLNRGGHDLSCDWLLMQQVCS